MANQFFQNLGNAANRFFSGGRQNRPKKERSPFAVQYGGKNPTSFSVPTARANIGSQLPKPSNVVKFGQGIDPRNLLVSSATPAFIPAKVPANLNTAAKSAATDYLANESALLQSGQKDLATQGSQGFTSQLFPSKSTIPTPASAGAAAGLGASAFSQANLKSVAQANLERLQQQYAALLAPSTKEQELQQQLTDLQGATGLGVSALEGQGRLIPLNLIRGQQARLQEQGNIQAQTLGGQLENERAAREAQANIYGTQLGFEQERLQNEQQQFEKAQQLQVSMLGAGYQPVDPSQVTDQNSVVQIGGQTYLKPSPQSKLYEVGGNLVNEQGQVVYQGQTGGRDTTGDFTIDGVRYDANGNIVVDTTSSPQQAGAQLEGAFSKLQLLDDILGSGGIEGAVGKGLFTRGPLRGGQQSVLGADIAQLSSQETLNYFTDLKAKGATFGALTGPELELLKTGAGNINYWMIKDKKTGEFTGKLRVKENAFRNEVTKMKSIALKGIDTALTGGEFTRLLNSGAITAQEYEELIKESAQGGGGGTFTNDLSTSQNGSIGSLSEKFESGGNPGAIGYDNTGGYSYGTYQLAHSNAKKFIEQSPFRQAFQGLAFNSPQFRQRWQQIAQQAPEQFKSAQKQYIAKTHYEPQLNKLAAVGIDINKLPSVVLDAIWSTAVQHGANTDVITKAFAKLPPTANVPDLLKQIYKERWSGGARFASSTANVQRAVYNRFFGPQGELAMALGRLQSQSQGSVQNNQA